MALARAGLTRRPNVIHRANRARDARQWELAAQFYCKALDRYPRNAAIWVQYGHALKEAGKLCEPDKLAHAELAYRKALSLNPSVADTYVQLGHALKLQGETEEAQAAYLRAFALDPSLPYPLQELSGLGWSKARVTELRSLVGLDTPLSAASVIEAGRNADEPELGRSRAVTKASDPTPQTYVDGCIDCIDGDRLVGWAAISGNSDPVDIELLIDGVHVSRAVANSCHNDLEAAGIGKGFHAFELKIPEIYFDGRPHEMRVRAIGTANFPSWGIRDGVIGNRPPAPPLQAANLPAPKIHSAIEVSVIMPTYNRGQVMERNARRFLKAADRLRAELIIIDDGSSDDTPERIRRMADETPKIVTDRIPNGGPAGARNLAASMARGAILVFVGDDVAPIDNDFLVIHQAAHSRFSRIGDAILGKISWPNASEMAVNCVMSHIQGIGEQQFGYYSMKAYSWYDWGFFYSSNVSVKKHIVRDWMTEGYDNSFHLAAFEDAEFALRTTIKLKEQKNEFGIFYFPAAALVHYHPYTVAGFLSRQISAGMMAQRFLELHPDCAARLGLADLIVCLAEPSDATPLPAEHYFAIFEGLKSWALVIEHHHGLGHKNWHDDLLRAVFQLAYFEGFLRVQSRADVNIANGCRYLLENIRTSLN